MLKSRIFVSISIFLCTFSVFATQHSVPGELLVQFKQAGSAKQKNLLRDRYQAKVKTRFQRLSVEHWKLSDEQSVSETIKALKNDPNVVFAEPNYRRYPASAGRAIPGEGQNNYQAQKTPFEQIRLEQLWDQVKGDPDVVVAVIDDAFDISHEDLRDNVVLPWNFVEDNNDPSPSSCFDTDFNEEVPEEHGTTVLGIVGATTNNGVGIAGAAWNVSVMPLKVGCMFDVAAEIDAFEYAVANGAHIINASYGGPMFSSAEEQAIAALKDSGVLLVAAAGNNEADNDKLPDYPSGLDLPNVISVAGSDLEGELYEWSQYGQTTVDIAAPASGFRTTEVNNSYDSVNGTSYSAPLVASVAALLKSAVPGASYSDIRGAILGSVTTMTDTNGRLATDGQLDALAALNLLRNPEPVIVIKSIEIDDGISGNGRIDYGENITLKLKIENIWQSIDDVSLSLSSPEMTQTIVRTLVNVQAESEVEVQFPLGILALQQNSGYEQLSFNLEIEWLNGGNNGLQTRAFHLDVGQLNSGKSVSSILRKTAYEQDDMHFYHIDVPAGTDELIVELELTDGGFLDADLAVRKGGTPLIDYLYYADPWGASSDTVVAYENGDDTIKIRSPAQATYHIAVIAPLDQNNPNVEYSLKATVKKASTGIGGCSISAGKFDPILSLMVVFSLLYLSLQRQKSTQSRFG